MIEFKGSISEACKKFIIKKMMKTYLLAGLAGAVSGGCFVVFVSIMIHPLLLLLLFGCMVFIAVMPFAATSKKDQKNYVPERIYIDVEDETIGVECEKHSSERGFENIKEIVDYGEWYNIEFFFNYKDPAYVIQKSLITQGTLEEFYNLFEDKIRSAKKIASKE